MNIFNVSVMDIIDDGVVDNNNNSNNSYTNIVVWIQWNPNKTINGVLSLQQIKEKNYLET